ncbi:MAG: hypothetical protein MZW92_55715 [Comamonadaceae bacterium]|nr:hypothetical protein [Comamonadaceae bacterium]
MTLARRTRLAVLLAALTAAAGCTPSLDWREVRVDGGAELLMPCRPRAATREVALAGRPVAMTLRACDADGRTWAIASADVGDAGRVAVALTALREAAAANVGAASGATRSLAVRGASTQALAARLVFDGRREDARPIRSDVALFASGSRVYQATVLGEGGATSDDGADTFFGSLRVGR